MPSLVFADADPWGNEYPATCSVEALAKISLPIILKDQATIDRACHAKGRFGCMTKTGYALIRDDLTGDLLAETIRHEKCHLVAGEWHRKHPQ